MFTIVPLFEIEVTPKTDKPNFCYRNRFIEPLSEQEFAREKAFWLGVFDQEFGLKVEGETFTYSKKDYEELRRYEIFRFGEEHVGEYCSPNLDPHFTPTLVKAPANIHYDSVYQMFDDLFNYTDTIKGTMVGAYKFKF